MRTRAYRRHKEEQKVITRLKLMAMQGKHSWPIDILGTNRYRNRTFNSRWIVFIGSPEHYMYKTHTTKKWDSERKDKWGHKGKKGRYDNDSHNTRVADKKFFKRMLKDDLGIEKFNFNYGSLQDHTTE